MSKLKWEAPRPQGGASRQGIIIHIVPLDPAYPSLAGRGTFRSDEIQTSKIENDRTLNFDIHWGPGF